MVFDVGSHFSREIEKRLQQYWSKESWPEVAGLGQVAWRRTLEEVYLETADHGSVSDVEPGCDSSESC